VLGEVEGLMRMKRRLVVGLAIAAVAAAAAALHRLVTPVPS
jgi:hypothetical protein